MLNTTDKFVKHKTGLLNLAEELGNVSKACQVMGISRDTFYRYKSAVDDGGVKALIQRTRRKPNLANRVSGDGGSGHQKCHRFPGLWSGPLLQRAAQTGGVCLAIRRSLDLAAPRSCKLQSPPEVVGSQGCRERHNPDRGSGSSARKKHRGLYKNFPFLLENVVLTSKPVILFGEV